MTNFFGTNTVVPNGYIYTSHKGSEYIVLEGVWFNHHDLKMVDPNKTQKMNEAAISQITKHNSTSKQMIGESFNFTGNTYVYLGNGRFTENGIVMAESALLTELIADDQRVYDVSRDTLQKEWNELQFNILPPHAEDITIPAGMDIHGFKYVPKGQRFIDAQTGRPAEPQMARKLYDAGVRLARQEASKHKLIPLNSTLVLGNTRGVWNGTEFCDNVGNVVVPAAKSKEIFSKYQQFVNANPQEFPSLVNSSNKEQRYGVGPKPDTVPGRNFGSDLVKGREEVTEAISKNDFSNFKPANPEKIEIPAGFSIGDYTYRKKTGDWQNGGKAVTDTRFNKELNTDAIKKIKELNAKDEYPVNSTIDYRGDKLTWNGSSWVNESGKHFKSSNFMDEVDQFIKTAPKAQQSSTETSIEGAENGLVVGKTKITDKNGKVFIYQGGEDFVNPDDESKLPDEIAKATVQRVNGTAKGEESSTVQEPAAQETQKQPAAQAEPTESAGNVPNGFAITSKAGVKYVKRAGQWISSQTKKALNSSAAQSVERAAETKIQKHNAESPVKIGDTWTSSKDKEYTYVGDNRFISSDGKMVPASSAQKIMDKLVSNAKTQEPENAEQEASASEDVPGLVVGKSKIKDKAGKTFVYQGGNTFINPDDGSALPDDIANGNIERFKQAQAGKASTSAADQGEPQASPLPTSPESTSTGETGSGDLESLAKQIKEHPASRKIQVLLTRGDKVSILAADILLSGIDKDAVKILKALNSSDE